MNSDVILLLLFSILKLLFPAPLSILHVVANLEVFIALFVHDTSSR